VGYTQSMKSNVGPGETGQPKRLERGPVVAGVVVVLVLCLVCCLAPLALQTGVASGQMGNGYVVQACVGVTGAPHFQLGVTWIAPFKSSLPPVILPNPACTLVPWLPFLPPRGGFAFP